MDELRLSTAARIWSHTAAWIGTLGRVNEAIEGELVRRGGVATRAQLLAVATRGTIDNELASGRVVAVFPRAYCMNFDADTPSIREMAAVMSVGHPASLSHTSGLRRWGLPVVADEDIHLVLPSTRNPRPTDGLVVHRVNRFPPVVRHTGLLTVTAPTAIVQSWPMAADADRRAPALVAIRDRLVTPADLEHAVTSLTRIADRRSLVQLIELLKAGCESQLELWGYLKVFDIRGLNHARRQVLLRAGGRRYRADMLYEAERLIIELDGRKYHASPEQWERDIARDLALAKIGWQTVRLSHRRLTSDVEGCQRDVLAVLATRRHASLSH